MTERIVQGDPGALRALLAHGCGALKVFPLPGAVVFPGTPAPFHIFEPRYRAMTEAALAGDRLIAVAPVRGKAEGPSPEIHPVATACVIEEEERLGDGRFNLVLRGVGRVRLLAELANGKLFREFESVPLEDVLPANGTGELAAHVHTLRQCVLDLASRLPPESGAGGLAEAAGHCPSPSLLADLVAAAVITEPEQRYRVLAELRVEERLSLVLAEVAAVILMLSRGRGPLA
jgi:Lon protease-like protein